MLASQNGHVEVVDKLVQHGARVDLHNNVCSLESHKMKGSAYSTLAVPTTAVSIPLTMHSIFLVHLDELCKQ